MKYYSWAFYLKLFILLSNYSGSAENFKDRKDGNTSAGESYGKNECLCDFIASSTCPYIVLVERFIVDESGEGNHIPYV